ncbi:CdaR family transcriptional regulator [Alicyclobacillus sp. SO9]|uniref:PucR family transcriptional regulator n=1 Tax=Alicyclobacillus sp. SO9 TaxID=2665646 RepID=UPI0018E9094F|nr:helix-turn-helix domain-containing protein [Alicyclobacillus sp. SO9]QQE80469.1 helix-turn-helix domain-containing protein [Alicyclobacillus sp. SO9]
MIPISEFLNRLECSAEQLAGQNRMDSLARDVVLLNHQDQIWLTRQKTDEFESALVFVQSRMFPGYLSAFDLLLRFLKQAGAVGVLFQGGNRSDFSKATVMLAENLELPLIWVPNPVKYSTMARHFYSSLIAQQRRQQAKVAGVRRDMESRLFESFTLHAWLKDLAETLDSTTRLRLSKLDASKPVWQNYRSSSDTGRDTLVVPIKILEKRYELCVSPSAACPLYDPDIQQVWIDELAGLLAAQVSYLLLLETPGILMEHNWVTSFESLVYSSMRSMPMFTMPNASNQGENRHSDVFVPDVVEPVSMLRRLDLLSLSPVPSISVLWMTSTSVTSHQGSSDHAETGVDEGATSLTRPYAYRLFRDDMLVLRGHALNLLRHARFSTGMQYDLLSCVPWRTWKSNEGIVVIWVPFAKTATYPSERMIRDFVSQLSARVQVPLRAFFHREDLLEDVTEAQDLLTQVVNVLETSYPEFLSQPSGSQSLQFSETGRDMANVILQGTSPETSYQHALGLLKPILGDKNHLSLIEALEGYLECGGKIQLAANRLHLHRNTMRYRLNRLEELLGVSLADAEVRFTYQVAVRTWRLNNGDAGGALSP